MTKPITPAEALDTPLAFPDEVVGCWNHIILTNLRNGSARVEQDAIVEIIASRMNCARQTVFDNHWLDVESLYRKAGWKVEYDKPGPGDTYKAFFIFTAPLEKS